MLRKYIDKKGVEHVYEYKKNEPNVSSLKRKHLNEFIQSHLDELNQLTKMNDKIKYVRENIDVYNYSNTMLYRYLKQK